MRERATGNVFAMKKLKKSEMVRRGQARGPPRFQECPVAPLEALRRRRAAPAARVPRLRGMPRPARAQTRRTAVPRAPPARARRVPQVDHVKAERNLLAEVNNPSIVKLFYSFQARARAVGASAWHCP